jgi:hypothetical protein
VETIYALEGPVERTSQVTGMPKHEWKVLRAKDDTTVGTIIGEYPVDGEGELLEDQMLYYAASKTAHGRIYWRDIGALAEMMVRQNGVEKREGFRVQQYLVVEASSHVYRVGPHSMSSPPLLDHEAALKLASTHHAKAEKSSEEDEEDEAEGEEE